METLFPFYISSLKSLYLFSDIFTLNYAFFNARIFTGLDSKLLKDMGHASFILESQWFSASADFSIVTAGSKRGGGGRVLLTSGV